MTDAFDQVWTAIDQLVGALDSRDPAAIVQASEALAAGVSGLYGADGSPVPGEAAKLTALLQQLDSAAIRVNLLGHWNRQQIDKMALERGMAQTGRYSKY